MAEGGRVVEDRESGRGRESSRGQGEESHLLTP